MVRARSFADVAACRAVSSPVSSPVSSIFREVSCFDAVASGKTLHTQMFQLNQVKMSIWYDRDGNVYD